MVLQLAQFPSATAACASGAGFFVCSEKNVRDLESVSTGGCLFPIPPSGPVKILAILGETLIAVREGSLSCYDVTWECVKTTDPSEIGLLKTHQLAVRDLCPRNAQSCYFVTSNGVFSLDSSGAIAEVAQIQKGEALWADESRIYVSKTDQRLMVLENGVWSCLTTLPSRATKIRGIGTTLCCSLRNGHSLFIDLQLLSSKLIEGAQLIDGGAHFFYLKRSTELILCSLTGEIRPIAQVPEGIGCIKPDGALCWIEVNAEQEQRNPNPIYD